MGPIKGRVLRRIRRCLGRTRMQDWSDVGLGRARKARCVILRLVLNSVSVCYSWGGRHMWQTHMWSVYFLLAFAFAGLALSLALGRLPEGYSSRGWGRRDGGLSLAHHWLRLLLSVLLLGVEELAIISFCACAQPEVSARFPPGG